MNNLSVYTNLGASNHSLADKKLQRKQNELLNTYSRLRRETP